MPNARRDIELTKEGDISIKDGDFNILNSEDSMKQHIENRLKTNDPEWLMYNSIGANLEDLRGEPNTKETGDMCEALIEQSLTYGNLISTNNLEISTAPTGRNQISAFIKLNYGYFEPIKLIKEIDL